MKELAKKVYTVLRKTNGESLMEAIISILVFTILIASITMMIMVSLRITSSSTEAANRRQVDANTVLSGSVGGVEDVVAFTIADGSGSSINVAVTVFSTENFTAFEPKGGGTP